MTPEPERPAQPTEPTKRCPFCGAWILAAAIQCKHCGSMMPLPSRQPPHAALAFGLLYAGGAVVALSMVYMALLEMFRMRDFGDWVTGIVSLLGGLCLLGIGARLRVSK
jgi:hypothetical protein